jgi:phospho-N-acetylmuramoyl-pentapeptide-transferase
MKVPPELYPLLAFWVALGTASLLAVPILKLLVRLKSRQTVSQFAPETHQVKQGTPTMGGLIPVVGCLVSFGAVLIVLLGEGLNRQPILGALILLIGFAGIGFVDDFVVPRVFAGKRGLGWKQKFALQFLVGSGAVAFLGALNAWQFVLALVVVVAMSNAYNFSDGLDGLAGCLLLGLAFGLIGIALGQEPSIYVLVLLAMVGAILPFLMLNAPPAKVFMGDIGSLPIGALFGYCVIGILMQPSMGSNWNWHRPIAMLVWSLVMLAELVPVPLQIFWVKVFKRKLFPMTPIHHAFEKAGIAETRVTAGFALTQVVLSCLAISIASFESVEFGR